MLEFLIRTQLRMDKYEMPCPAFSPHGDDYFTVIMNGHSCLLEYQSRSDNSITFRCMDTTDFPLSTIQCPVTINYCVFEDQAIGYYAVYDVFIDESWLPPGDYTFEIYHQKQRHLTSADILVYLDDEDEPSNSHWTTLDDILQSILSEQGLNYYVYPSGVMPIEEAPQVIPPADS